MKWGFLESQDPHFGDGSGVQHLSAASLIACPGFGSSCTGASVAWPHSRTGPARGALSAGLSFQGSEQVSLGIP